MKKTFETSKLYPCYPVFIVSYYDDDKRVNISANSSSYSLGNTFVMGVGERSTLAKKIQQNKVDFCINFLSCEYLNAIETSGHYSNTQNPDKTEKSGLTFYKSEHVDAPYIDEASLIFECKPETIHTVMNQKHLNVIAHIVNRLCDDELLDNGNFNYGKLNIPLYEGDAKKRVYRFMDTPIISSGFSLKKK